ncbi:MAG TPA: DNA repair protein RecN [Solirubrobacteraceae bacterium]|nr:DNA repair protein RecN [Solirubrobacteraceae bacterium]
MAVPEAAHKVNASDPSPGVATPRVVLQELRVENLLLIEEAQLRLASGLNVLTGETGAGKTVLAHALDLLLGGRARAGIVRPGACEAYVEGVFDLPERLRERLGERVGADTGEIVLARRVGADGRTRAYLGGRAASVAELREAGAALLAFYGQHEHRKLTLAAAQLEILDGVCAGDQAARLRACGEACARVGELELRLQELRGLSGERERELELLAYELAEIDALAPQEGEHERLLAARERLRRLDALTTAAAVGAHALAPETGENAGAAQLLADACGALAAQAGVDPLLDGLAERMRGLAIESRELASELREYGERAAFDGLEDVLAGLGEEVSAPGRGVLDALEARLAAIERVTRKHGGSVPAALAYAQRARERHEQLTGAEVAMADAGARLAQAREQLERCVQELRRARRAAAGGFAERVREQLRALAMGEASFEVVLGEREPGPRGGDTVEFMIAPNPGVSAAPLREIASGGELSRVMLAIMSVARAQEANATLVFDEVDAGIGGHTARAVGARLRELAERRQVLCITHLPQVASLGARHFSIVKDSSGQTARTSVVQLGEREVVSELVRMLGADGDDVAARRHARDLRSAA